MATETTYSRLRETLSATLDKVVDDQEVVIVRRRGAKPEGSKDVALIPASELAGLMETAHLLRSDKNATRLIAALRRAERGSGKPQAIASLKRELRIAED